jgi:hypothetical protein
MMPVMTTAAAKPKPFRRAVPPPGEARDRCPGRPWRARVRAWLWYSGERVPYGAAQEHRGRQAR